MVALADVESHTTTVPDGCVARLALRAAPFAWTAQRRHELASVDAALLAWLALEGPTPRERLASLLWPASAAEAARNALRQRLFRLRRQLDAEVVLGTQRLVLAPGVSHDLDGASTLLGDLRLPGCDEFDAWLLSRRQAAQALHRRVLVQRIEALEGTGDAAAALPLARELLAGDPLSEDAHRRVMRLHYLCGDRSAALLAYDHCARTLKEEIGARPSAPTLELLHLVDRGREPTPPGAAGAPAPPPGTAWSAPLPVALLRPPRMIGREAQKAALLAAWRAGTPAFVLGEGGIGKTRLLQSLASDGVVSASARPGDALVPYATLARGLAELAARAPGVAQALPSSTAASLLPLLPDLADPADLADQTARVPAPSPEQDHSHAPRRGSLVGPVAALLQACARAGAIEGLVFDDLHFADEASLDMLLALLDAPRDAGAVPALRWCFALRPPAPASHLATFVETLGRAAPTLQLTLPPLEEPQLDELVDSLGLPGVTGAAWARALHQRCGGNPLFALETLKLGWEQRASRGPCSSPGTAESAEQASPGPDEAMPRPRSLDQLIADQLGRLSAQALALARLAAVAGTDFTLGLAEQVLRRDALELADAWLELEHRHVLAGTQFAHELLLEAVRAGVPAVIARHLHARVAAHLESTGGEPARLAAHWQAAGEPRRAVPALRAAAAHAHRTLRQRERIALLLRAAELAEAEGDLDIAFEVLGEAVETHMNSLRDAVGYPLLDRLDALARTPHQRARAAGWRAWYLSQLPDHAQAARVGQVALELAEPLGDLALTGSIRQRLATTLAMLGRFDAALPHLQAVQAWAEAHLAPEDLAELHGNLAVVLDNVGQPGQATEHHERASELSRAIGDHAQHLTHLANHAVNRLDAGDAPAAAALAQEAFLLAERHRLEGASVAFVALLRSKAARAQGHYTEALAAADEALALLEAHNPARRPLVWTHRAACWLELGQPARAGHDLEAAMAALDTLPPHVRARLHLVRARWLSALGRAPAGALRQARDALPAQGWPEVRIAVEIECASVLPDEHSLPALRAAADRANALGLQGHALVAAVWAAARQADSPAAPAKAAPVTHIEALAAVARSAVAALPWIALGAHTPAQMLHVAASALRAAGSVETAEVVTRAGLDWLHQTASAHVPEAFRESFLHRVPGHAGLAPWAAATIDPSGRPPAR